MKAGTIFRRFQAKDNREVILRAPDWGDLDDLLFYINSLVDEQAEIGRTILLTRDREADWLGRHLAGIEKDAKLAIVVEVDNRVVGQLEVEPRRGYFSHVAEVGIGLLSPFRDIGIGTVMMEEAEKHVESIGVEILYLEVFATNARALHVYGKLGYRETGAIPRGAIRKGEYVDMIQMVKDL